MSIAEFPGLQIDDFRDGFSRATPLLYLLTHMHSDHLLGLERLEHNGPKVYCSKATRGMVLQLRESNGTGALKYTHLANQAGTDDILVGLDLDVPHAVSFGHTTLQITLIAAYHCPGATMFLIEDTHGQSVLFTGDVRCEPWWVNSLEHHAALSAYTFGKKPLSIYIDNTFSAHANDEHEYMETKDGIRMLLAVLSRGYTSDCTLAAVFSTVGYEEVLLALASQFESKVHMDPYYVSLYRAAADHDPLARKILSLCTRDGAQARVHWCRKNGDCSARSAKNTVFFSPCVTICEAAVSLRNKSLRIEDFQVVGQCEQPAYIDCTTGARYVLANDRHTLLPGHLLFYFSRHASQNELRHLLSLFSVCRVADLAGNPIAKFSDTVEPQPATPPEPVVIPENRASTGDGTLQLTKMVKNDEPLPIYKKEGLVPRPADNELGKGRKARKLNTMNSSDSESHQDVLDFLQAQHQKYMTDTTKPSEHIPASLERATSTGSTRDASSLARATSTRPAHDCASLARLTSTASAHNLLSLAPTSTGAAHNSGPLARLSSTGTAHDSNCSAPPVPSIQKSAKRSPHGAGTQESAHTVPSCGQLVTPPGSPSKDIRNSQSQNKEQKGVALKAAACSLETQLRENPEMWFQLNFDWRAHRGVE